MSNSIAGTSLPPPPVKSARVKVDTVSIPPPAASILAPRVEPETIVARHETSSLASFCLWCESGGLPSGVGVVATPPAGKPVGSPACSSLTPGDFLTTFAEGENVEIAYSVSSAGVETS
ncbi:hypothetical protein AMTR_s00008p00222090 [Amborella trichopoda]|uniref:Uncharacterized protein n=1 Tax=Amborella trichopoda TaxID=13333 RepID=W1NJI1_AMBTC|nr:hypothetical protein AMTR_s00008p00222090 [Amborella trichopoda]